MIKEFKNITGRLHKTDESVLFLRVGYVNRVNLQDPTIKVTFSNGEVVDMELLEGNQKQDSFTLSEVEKFQTMVYISKLPHDRLERLMFGGD